MLKLSLFFVARMTKSLNDENLMINALYAKA